MNKIVIFYVPCPEAEAAKKIARTLLSEKLIACANILDGCTSLYEWKGEVVEAKEVILILKTTKDLQEKVLQIVEKEHPYECSAILQFSDVEANLPFYDWVAGQTKTILKKS